MTGQIPMMKTATASMPSMKKLVTNVTGTVSAGPATGYIANGLGKVLNILPCRTSTEPFASK